MRFSLIITFICCILISCGSDDSSTNPNEYQLPELIISTNHLGVSVPIVWNSLEIDSPNLNNIAAYIGEYAPENYLGTLTKQGDNFSITLQLSLETKDRFIRYESLSPDSIVCNPTNLSRTKKPVRFFTIKDNEKQYEVFLEQTNKDDPNEFDARFEIYFWSEKGTASGHENGYICDYDVEKGWNVTMCDGDKLTNINSFGENVFLVIRDEPNFK